jgi:aryl-alcohol dehydrogenase-like predicted oxidoreductase
MLRLRSSTIDIRDEYRRSAGAIVNCVDAMRPIAERRQVSVAQIALAWLLAKPAVSSVIIGAKSAEQLHDNIASTRVHLSAAELEALDAISQLPAEYPGWMLSLQGQYRSKPPVNQ